MLGTGEDGIEVMRDLLQISPDTCAILMFGWAVAGDYLRAIEAGAYRYVTKPYDVRELVWYLRSAGQLAQTNRASHQATLQKTQVQSCFMSFYSKDQEFADCLHHDLVGNGVEVGFAPKDMRIGDKIRARIEQSIQIYDRLGVVLSEHSIGSTWVADEVEAALEKERNRSSIVLFPITVDATVWETHEPWAAKLRRERHIGDFRRWKEHDAYQASLERLLRDLRTEID